MGGFDAAQLLDEVDEPTHDLVRDASHRGLVDWLATTDE